MTERHGEVPEPDEGPEPGAGPASDTSEGPAPDPAGGAVRPRWGTELLIVAGLSLGQSAVYAVVRLIDLSTRGPLAEAQARLNTEASPRPWFDLVHQLLGIGFALLPVALVLFLMSRDRLFSTGDAGAGAGSAADASGAVGSAGAADRPDDALPVRVRIGLDAAQPGRDLWRGALLFLVIGIGTLGVYWAGRSLGLTAEILPNNLAAHWWTVPVLILAALKNGLLEEVLLLGYGMDRLRRLAWSPWAIIVVLAVARGSYHLYQGIGPFIGNVLMGLLFGWLMLRYRRVMPFVLAHTFIDVAGFLAPGLLAAVDPLV